MPVSALGYLELVAVTLMRMVVVVLAFAAFWSLRQADEVVLKARLYMNRRRIFSGLLFVGLGMLAFLAQGVAELAYVHVADERLPIEITGAVFVVGVACLVVGFYNFHRLSRPSPATPRAWASAPSAADARRGDGK